MKWNKLSRSGCAWRIVIDVKSNWNSVIGDKGFFFNIQQNNRTEKQPLFPRQAQPDLLHCVIFNDNWSITRFVELGNFMSTSQLMGFLFFCVSLSAWWIVVWLGIKKRESVVIPFIGSAILGIGVPGILADLFTTFDVPSYFNILWISWTVLPVVLVCLYYLKFGIRQK